MKSDPQNKVPSTGDLQQEAESIAEYLLEHHDFFIGREDLLLKLTIPHESGKAISLLERKVILLREKNEELNRQIRDFVANAKHNDALFEKTRIIILELLKADTLEDLVSVIETKISADFNAAESKLLFITDDSRKFPGLLCRTHAQAKENLGQLFEKKRTFCGEVTERQVKFLFPQNKRNIVSVAIVPVHVSNLINEPDFPVLPVLIIGSGIPNHFNKSQDTLFLDFIGEVLAALIASLLQ